MLIFEGLSTCVPSLVQIFSCLLLAHATVRSDPLSGHNLQAIMTRGSRWATMLAMVRQFPILDPKEFAHDCRHEIVF